MRSGISWVSLQAATARESYTSGGRTLAHREDHRRLTQGMGAGSRLSYLLAPDARGCREGPARAGQFGTGQLHAGSASAKLLRPDLGRAELLPANHR